MQPTRIQHTYSFALPLGLDDVVSLLSFSFLFFPHLNQITDEKEHS